LKNVCARSTPVRRVCLDLGQLSGAWPMRLRLRAIHSFRGEELKIATIDPEEPE